MKKMGAEQLDQESFKSAYDSDPRIKQIINHFDPNGVHFEEKPKMGGDEEDSDQDIQKMADRAAKKALK
jgi:hypothetical protein